ncbi:hypothetical protein J4464_06475 [Candidatus Woesearchaeota archaeon]|nr:hypothetical protein [Candidatus Woesearchaeota archaeon]
MTTLELLVVDNDVQYYGLKLAYDAVKDRLAAEGTDLTLRFVNQDEVLQSIETRMPDVIIVDNDYGHGLRTLKEVLDRNISAQIGYTAAYPYDLKNLREYKECFGAIPLEQLNVTVMKKPDIVELCEAPQDLVHALHAFLRSSRQTQILL